jgi:nucleotide sugar dehydrogenase
MENTEPVGCIGMGFVGLKTALSFCESGTSVSGLDVDTEVVEDIRNGISPVSEQYMNDEISSYVDSNLLEISSNPEDLSKCGSYIISVPTPVDEDNNPDMRHVESATQAVSRILDEGDLVVLQSTVPTGTCKDTVIPMIESVSGLESSKEFGVSFVPERYSPNDEESLKTPRVVGSVSDEWRDKTMSLYTSISENLVPVSSIEAAESIKLIENVQRDVNMALINEFAHTLWKKGINMKEVLDGAETKWNFHRYDPSLGVGGHCIPVDPYHFIDGSDGTNIDPILTKAARKVNDRSPEIFGEAIKNMTENSTYPESVAIIGLSYKPGTDDTRNSPAIKLIEHLISRGVEVTAYDPLVKKSKSNHIQEIDMKFKPSVGQAVEDVEVIVLNTLLSELSIENKDLMSVFGETPTIDVFNSFDNVPSMNIVDMHEALSNSEVK